MDVAVGSGVAVSVGVMVGVSVGGASVGVDEGSMVAVGGFTVSVGGMASAVVSLGILQAERINITVVIKQKNRKYVVRMSPPGKPFDG